MVDRYRITEAEMDRRKRVQACVSAIMEAIEPHAADKMTPMEVITALAHVQARFIQMGMNNEAEE